MTGPSKAVEDVTVPPVGTDPGSRLREAAEYARAEPRAWVFVGWSTSPVSEVTTRFCRDVIEGRKATLGPGRWNAACERGYVDADGEPHVLADGAEPPGGEEVVTLKWVAFLGDDDTDE